MRLTNIYDIQSVAILLERKELNARDLEAMGVPVYTVETRYGRAHFIDNEGIAKLCANTKLRKKLFPLLKAGTPKAERRAELTRRLKEEGVPELMSNIVTQLGKNKGRY